MHDRVGPPPVAAGTAPRRSWTAWTGTMLRDLAHHLSRRPLTPPEGRRQISHSSDVRTLVWAFAGTDLVTGFVIEGMIPSAGRAPHLVWMVFSLVLSLGFCAMTARSPHLLDSTGLRLRTGPFGELTIPVETLGSVRVAHGSVQGHGLRRVPDEDDAVACTVGSGTGLVIDLDEPLLVRLRKGEPVSAKRVYAAADQPGEAARLISRSLSGGGTS